ncbi:MAG: outer membrane protein assembly factor BamA [Gammaproteobacteria bacterium]|uniref:Outer membrane protein assembly factor BamA n=1 Tax=OM182 bacterium TaxID=2510334 RepID=A0A520S440_9GAMM|nr:outer membrane protein assembly factor BamA [Gammaproteobacteria bacterium]RZO77199.1 MAG: outer membrane protein assembly factor BamA [OM182 bacterium]
MVNRLRNWIVILVFAFSDANAFIFNDVRVEGLQRISAGTVFSSIPFNTGDDVDELDVRLIIESLFETGSFDDVQVGRDGDVLVIIVNERPSIDKIEIEGNKAIKTEDLLEGLSDSGLAVGQIFKKVTLEYIASGLERQYVSQGRYDASIKTEVLALPRNRVLVKVDVDEGNVSSIKHINIVGNTLWDDDTLLDLMELKLSSWSWLLFWKKDDQYSKEKLESDLESLESWYLDRGYLNFAIESTQVSISPNMQDVYITINISEGDKFTVSSVDIAGELFEIPEKTIRSLILSRPGQTFSRQLMTSSEERIERVLGNAGYTFASTTGETVVDESGETVSVKFFVDAGKRAYVRRITFRGNTATHDEVLRREMRQMEAGWASTAAIEHSKVRLERLGFFKEVTVDTPAVPGTEDQIDVNYTVEEQPSGAISASLGYAGDFGLILGANYQENNVFGTGNSVGIGINRSDFQKAFNFSFMDPYFTLDGVSRGYSVFFRESDFEERNIARFSTDSSGGSINFGYPLSEVSRLGFNLGFERTLLKEGIFPVQEISRFLAVEGNKFDLYTLTGSYVMSALNRGLLPNAGRSQSISLEMTLPGSDLEFFRINYAGQVFFPLSRLFTLRLRADLGYGEAYGDTNVFPFYKHFYTGGMGSVRGYENNTLGPRGTPSPLDTYARFDPIGGNVLVETSAEILFPLPFVKDQQQIKSALFIDAGNVFNTNCAPISVICNGIDDGELRYSAGVAVTWITGFAPLSFALSFPFNEKSGDESEAFQFEIGRTF